MKRKTITRRIAGAVLAAALSLGGLAVAGSLETHDAPDHAEEVASGTWSFTSGKKGGWQGTNGATWS